MAAHIAARTSWPSHGASTVMWGMARKRHDDADLVEVARGDESGKRAEPGHEADRGQAGGDAGHVLLGDAHLQEAVGPRLVQDVGARGVGQVAVEHEQIGIGIGQLDQRLAEHDAWGQQLRCGGGHAGPPSPSSASAAARKSAGSGLACQANWFSMNETPLPLTVWAMMTVGRPGAPSWAWRSVCTTWAMSWPSISCARQPNASQRARISGWCSGRPSPPALGHEYCGRRLWSTIPTRLSSS